MGCDCEISSRARFWPPHVRIREIARPAFLLFLRSAIGRERDQS